MIEVNGINYLATFGKHYLWLACLCIYVLIPTETHNENMPCHNEYKTIIISVKSLNLFNFKSHHILMCIVNSCMKGKYGAHSIV